MTRLVRSRKARLRGFTLVELLVVISIIGMLIALLLPAVNAARETARSANCLNNITQLGKAVIAYDSRQNSYPGYANVQAIRSSTFDLQNYTLSSAPDPDIQFPSPTGWVFPLLTYLDRNDLAEQYGARGRDEQNIGRKGVPPENITLEIVQCPSDINAQDEGKTGASYVVNTGFEDVNDNNFPYCEMAVEPGKSPDYAANGVFHNAYPYMDISHSFYENLSGTENLSATSNPFKIVKTSSSTLLSGDGTSNTLILSENVDGGRWTDYFEYKNGFIACPAVSGAGAPAKPRDPNVTLYTTTATPTRTVAPVYWINEKAGQKATAASGDSPYLFARPSSYHANGVNVFFAGGSGKFLSDTIDPLVYVQLLSVHGSKQVVPSEDGPDTPDTAFLIYATPLDEGSF